MKTEEQIALEKTIENEILSNLKIEATSSYDGWNGSVVEIKLFYNDYTVSETRVNIL